MRISKPRNHSGVVALKLHTVRPLLAALAGLLVAGCATTEFPPLQDSSSSGNTSSRALASEVIVASQTNRSSLNGDIVWIRQPLSLPGPVVARVKTSPVTVTREFDALLYDPAHVAVGSSIPDSAPDNLSDWILVSGGYTPKGIYSRPDQGSRILTRVAPGARLRLEESFGGWMKVETEQGIGYLQAADARLLSAQNATPPRTIVKPQHAKL